MRIIILLVVFMSFFQFSFSQENRQLISGAVQFEYSESTANGIYITNLDTGEIVITSILGQFKIEVKEGDSLLIESEDIYTTSVLITANNMNNNNLIIFLETYSTPLSDVISYGGKLTGFLEYDIKRTNYKNEQDRIHDLIGLPYPKNNYDSIKSPFKNPLTEGIGLDLDALYDIISGERRKKLAYFDYLKINNLINQIYAYFPNDYFTKELLIPKDDIKPFIATTIGLTNIEDFVRQNNYVRVKETLRQQSFSYLIRLKYRTPLVVKDTAQIEALIKE